MATTLVTTSHLSRLGESIPGPGEPGQGRTRWEVRGGGGGCHPSPVEGRGLQAELMSDAHTLQCG